MTKTKIEPSFEEAMANLETIIKQIESGEAKLDEAMVKYKEGMELIKFCQEKLQAVEQQVKILDAQTNSLKDFSI